MAISRFSDSSIQDAFPKYNSLWDGRSAVGSMDAITSITLPAAQTSITFSNIPQTYSHLQIRSITKVSADGNPILRVNSDTAANYVFHQVVGDGTSASSSGGTAQTFIYQPYALAAGNMAMIIDILDYANINKFKTIKTFGGNDNNGSGYSPIELMSGLWRSTNAITSITISGNGFNLAQYSSFALYGIK